MQRDFETSRSRCARCARGSDGDDRDRVFFFGGRLVKMSDAECMRRVRIDIVQKGAANMQGKITRFSVYRRYRNSESAITHDCVLVSSLENLPKTATNSARILFSGCVRSENLAFRRKSCLALAPPGSSTKRSPQIVPT